MVLTRRDLLRSALAGATVPILSCGGSATQRLVVVAARGGWDTMFAFDHKLSADGFEGPELHATDDPDDVDAVRTFAGLPIVDNAVRRPAVGRFFERWADRSVVVNGIEVGTIAHVECVRRMWTGGDDSDAPDVAAIGGHLADHDLPIGCLDLGPGVQPGILATSTVRLGWNGQARGLVAPAPWVGADASAISAWRHRRAVAYGTPPDELDAFAHADRVGAALTTIAFDPDDPIATALSALRADLCGSVYLDLHLPWDTHGDNGIQDECFEEMFDALDRLADGLGEDLDRTLVVVLSEMGRMPVRNQNGGKDHWPVTSAFLFGGGIAGGRVIGGTDGGLAPLAVDLRTGDLDPGADIMRPANVLAGVLDQLGADADRWFPDVVPLRLS